MIVVIISTKLIVLKLFSGLVPVGYQTLCPELKGYHYFHVCLVKGFASNQAKGRWLAQSITREVSNARVMAGKQHLKLTLSTNLSVQTLCALK